MTGLPVWERVCVGTAGAPLIAHFAMSGPPDGRQLNFTQEKTWNP